MLAGLSRVLILTRDPTRLSQRPARLDCKRMPDCFIIMPITTPDPAVYQGDDDHFKHVLENLFIPAVEAAGLNPIPPNPQGSDMIHVNVIHHLQKADLVLRDMSTLNANVFFELGIRTATAKPVSHVKDSGTPKVPFDVTVVNYYEYSRGLEAWLLKDEIKKLADHIKSSLDRSKGENMLWKYFGLQQRAEFVTPANPMQATISMLVDQVQGLSKKLDETKKTPFPRGRGVPLRLTRSPTEELLARLAQGTNGAVIGISTTPDESIATVFVNRELSPAERLKAEITADGLGIKVAKYEAGPPVFGHPGNDA